MAGPICCARHNRQQLEGEVIPGFLARQRWFAAKDQRIKAVSVEASGVVERPSQDGAAPESFLASLIEVTLARGQQHYFLPLAALWSPAETELRQGLLQVTLAELRQFRREGALVDALSQDGFVLALMEAIGRETTLPLDGGEIRCLQTPSYDRAAVPEQLTVRRAGLEQSNSSVFFDEFGMLKLYRRLEAGPHPEIEMSRFLVERAGFANTPPPLATIELAVGGENEKRTMALGVLFGFVRNQGDGWTQALNYLTRYLDDALIATDARSSELADPDVFFLALARQIGIRTAEMHRALAEHGGDDPDFAPEPITREDLAEWRTALETETASMLSRLEREAARLPATGRERAEQPAFSARPPVRAYSHPAPRRGRGAKDPLARRLSSGSGHRRAKRLLHRRFRGRAVASARHAAGQELAVARRGRDDPLV